MKHFNLIWAVLACQLFTNFSYGQCTLACNDLVNVSLPQEGFGVITPEIVLDGEETSCPGPKTVTVYSPEGESLHDTVTCGQLNLILNVTVFDQNSGNSCWGTLFIQDYLPPIITCSDLTVTCTTDLSPDSLGYPLVVDNCDNSPNLTYTGQPVMQPCNSQYSAILMRTWHAVDASNNYATPCVQKVFVVRPSFADIVFPPNLDGFQAPPLSCPNPNTNPSNTGFPTIDGKAVSQYCKMTVTYEDLVIGGCENEQSVLRSWIVLNCCTNQILEHDQIIKVSDDIGPVLNCMDSLTFSTNGPSCASTFFLPAMSAADNCSSTITWRTLTPWAVLNSNGGMVYSLPQGTYIVTYEATDACGNVSTCQVTVIVKDNVSPVAICTEFTVVALSNQGLATLAAHTLDNGSYDACCPSVTFLANRMDQPNAPFTPTVQFNCADVGNSVAIILQVTDCKGNKNTCMVQVDVQDKTAPTIICPSNITIPCSTILPPAMSLTGSPTTNDNCAVDTLYFADANNFNLCHVGTITRTFSVVDIAGYQTSCSQVITTVDNTPVKFFFPPDTIVGCDRPLDSLEVGEPSVLKDCELFGLNISDEIFPIPCGLKIFRTYTYLEWCTGYDTSYTQFIKVLDTNGPVWDDPIGSQDMVFLCGSDVVKPPPPTATDYCSPDSVYIISDVKVPGDCPNHFSRTLIYEAIDTCGNVSVPFVQHIIVNDTLPPFANPLPTIGPFTCYGNIPAPNVNDVTGETDNCIDPVTVTWVSDGPNPGCMGTVVRTYQLADNCGNSALITQNILINDNVAPTADPLPSQNLFCASQIPAPNVDDVTGETDNCGGPVTVQFVSDLGSPACFGTMVRTYSLTDICNNTGLITQQFNINDTIPPTPSWPDTIAQTIVGLACEDSVVVQATAVDNCPGNPVTITNSYNDNGANASDSYPVGETIVTWTFSDACGNSVTQQTVVSICETITPSITCNTITIDIDSNGIAVLNIDSLLAAGFIGGSDNCTEVTFDITPDTITCADLTGDPTMLTYMLTVTDACGNSTTCDNGSVVVSDPLNICIQDDTLVVSGLIFNEFHQPLTGVDVQLSDNGNMSHAFSQNLGLFVFQNVPPGMSCKLQPVKEGGLLNGVTTFDLVILQNHILGTQSLTSPYKLIAADVNNSGSISTFDIVSLRKAILHMTDSFPNNNAWRFIEAGYHFPNPNNPFVEPLPESTWLNNMHHDMSGRNFVAVKIGDLNNSAVLNFHEEEVEERNQAGELTLAVPNWKLAAGKEVRIPVNCGEAVDLAALQGTIEFDPTKMSFVGAMPVELDGLGADNFGEPATGSLTMSWHNASGQPLEAGSTLFYLQFLMYENASVEGAIAMNSTITPAIAYENGGIPLNVRWRIHEAPQMPVDAAPLFLLGQNRPNPFNAETRIEFMLKERMPVTLEIIDLSGRKTLILQSTEDAGWHEVVVDKSMMGGPGVYIYQLTTPSGTERRKMVFQ
ncbi:MAG: T9SS type A sorting domain-containing protein [Saprospiraceae bacterium]|nr:T9SS type A sorting domain-containing protein [Saprospiraceae bacterium]MCF8248760.1 T9SS type A sorting domain-containing protein [Saprospiraceae bacterium]MCF8278750.1 T9SS type A sorting domain-containing protein [Bacteroidales bacterium]MCF8310550.1 T9SS type A sorting domain-containing protein [Saprospiraceae bacterium]MCF8439109.1 T9SS type A sorting domain-containing protein [Saprospiraceae bacterium]